MLERVQRRALKCVTGMHDKSYEERLDLCDMISLEDRRKRTDIIETYKYLQGSDKKFFYYTSDRHTRQTRGAEMKLLVPEKCMTNVRREFFPNRVVAPWNDLPLNVREAPSLPVFKKRLDKFMNWNKNK